MSRAYKIAIGFNIPEKYWGRLKNLLVPIIILVSLSLSFAQTAPELGEAERFAVLAGDSITSTDSAFVKGDAGAGTRIDSTIISDGGTFRDSTCIVESALRDLDSAKQAAEAQPPTAGVPQTLRDTTLTSGVYQINKLNIQDTVILSGDSSSVFIFNVSDSLVFEANSVIILDGVKAENIFWNVGTDACLQDSAIVCGTVMADGSICCHDDAQVKSGRLLSEQTVTLSGTDSVTSRREQVFTVNDIDLGAAAYFAALAGGNLIANDPISAVGNVGAMGAISGAITTGDTLFSANDCRVQQAVSDLGNVVNVIQNIPGTSISGNLGGQILAAGVYDIPGYAALNGILTLTGDSSSIYVFRISDSLTVDTGAVLDLGNVRAENVYWIVEDNVTLKEDIGFLGLVITTQGNIRAKSRNAGYLALFSNNGSIHLFNDNPNNFTYLYARQQLIALNQITFPNNVVPCQADEYFRLQAQRDPSLQKEKQDQDFLIKALIDGGFVESQFIIPVVVHIIHDPAHTNPGTVSNITDFQILNALEVLNREFNNECMTGNDNMEIQFCLATTDLQGNSLPGTTTPGIIRIADNLTTFDITNATQEQNLKSLSFYNSENYLNIWVVSNIQNPQISNGIIAGYASFPGGPPNLDGIVMRYDRMGNIANTDPCMPLCTGCNLAGSSAGRTLVHEAGHYLNLYHTFEGGCDVSGCAASGDWVCDTPPADNRTFGCPAPFTNSCSANPQLENFMEYTDEVCKFTFSDAGQRLRMHAALTSSRSALTTTANLQTTGIQCTGLLFANFTANPTQGCLGNTVDFQAAYNSTTAIYDWDFGDGNTASITGNPATSHVYNTEGQFTVTLSIQEGTDQVGDFVDVFAVNCQPISSSQGFWYFGQYAGLDFSSGVPVADLSAFNASPQTINSSESAVAQSDDTGNLLFYSNGMQNVWDDAHNNLTSTLSGGGSPSQSITVPNPANPNQYYLLYMVGGNSSNNFYYQLIDISGGTAALSGPEVAVILPGGVSGIGEQITAVPNCNGVDYWVIVHNTNNPAQFLVYNLSASGFTFSAAYPSNSPINGGANSYGYLKASPNGSKLALAKHWQGRIMLYDFDKNNGTISNPLQLSNIGGYGVSFSPDSRFLYASRDLTSSVWQQKLIVRYDILLQNPQNTEEIIFNDPAGFFAMQLGPDNRIYIAKDQQDNLAVINFPDDQNNTGFNFDGPTLKTAPSQNLKCIWGLPNMIDAKTVNDLPPLDFSFIVSNCFDLDFNAPQCYTSHSWNFDVAGVGGVTPSTSGLEDPPTVTYSSFGQYTVELTATGPNGIETIQKDITIGIDPPVIAGDLCTVVGLQNYSVANLNPGFIYNWDITVNTSPVTSFSINNVTNIDVDWQGVGGTITLTANDPVSGCSTTANFTPSPGLITTVAITSDYNGQDISCNGASDGQVTATPTCGSAPYAFSWDTSPVQTNAVATGLSAGTYTVTVTDANSTTASASVTLNDPLAISTTAAVSSNYNGADISCNGASDGEATVTASGGTGSLSYLWDDLNAQTTQTATGLAGGTYTVTVTDANGCTATDNVTLTNPPLLTATISSFADPLCNGDNNGEATVTATGGTGTYTYLWDDPNAQTTTTAAGLSAGTYTVSVTDANNCMSSISVQIIEPAFLVAILSSTIVNCNGGSTATITTTVSGGTTPYTYAWTGPGSFSVTTQNLSGLSAGTYNVTVTDNNGCVHINSIGVAEPPPLVLTVSTTPVCDGASVLALADATGGVASYTYLWSTGATGGYTTLGTGAYSVTVTDGFGCQTVQNLSVNVAPVLVLTVNTANVTCNGATDGSITLAASGGLPPYSYSFDGGPFTPTNVLSGLAPGCHDVNVLDAEGCWKGFINICITQPPFALSTSIAFTVDESCPGANDGQASVNVTGGTTPYSYLWSSGETSPSVSVLSSGANSVVVTDANGCTSTSNFTLTAPTPLSVTFTVVTPCDVVNDGEITATPAGGTGIYTYLWANGQNTSTITGLGFGSYDVTISDNNGCQLNATAVINATVYDLDNSVFSGSGTTILSGAITAHGEVIIENGYVLEFNNAQIEFSYDVISEAGFDYDRARFIVRNGGELILYGTTITGCNGGVWDGIEVWGDAQAVQSDPVQGELFIQTGTIIENAHIGVLCGRRSLKNVKLPPTSGGKVRAIGGDFINNRVAVRFNSYTVAPRASFFTGTDFLYDGNSLFPYFYNQPFDRMAFIEIFDSRGVKFTDCDFTTNITAYPNVDQRGTAIRCISCGVDIVNAGPGNTFNGLTYGVRALQYQSKFRNILVDDNTFNNVKQGIYIQGGSYDELKNNTFNIPAVTDAYGVFIVNSAGFFIDNNTFTGTVGGNYGMLFENTGNSGSIAFANSFENTDFGIQTQGLNPNLKIKCNTFSADGNPHNITAWASLDINGTGSLRHQGTSACAGGGLIAQQSSAGNKWLYPCNTGDKEMIVQNIPPFDYWYNNLDEFNQPVTQPICVSGSINDMSCFNNATNNTCGTGSQWEGKMISDPGTDPIGFIEEAKTVTGDLKSEVDSGKALLAGGDKPQFYADVDADVPHGQLKDKLLLAGPYLSDSLMIHAFTQKPTPLPNGHIKNIAIANSPLTQPVLDTIQTLNLPNGIQNQIDQQQFGENVRDLLKREVIYKTAELNDLESGMVRVFLELDSIEGAKEVLQQSVFLHSKKTLAGLLLAEGDYTAARTLVDSIGLLGGNENTNYAALNTVLIDLAEDSVALQDMDATQETTIRNVAAGNTLVATQAEVVLTIVFGEEFVHPIMKIQQINAKWAGAETAEEEQKLPIKVENEIFKLYPNPNDGSFIIEYAFTEQKAVFTLYDITGRKVKTLTLTGNKTTVNAGKLPQGLYHYKVNSRDKIIASDRFLIIK